jgi:hypothetical protein
MVHHRLHLKTLCLFAVGLFLLSATFVYWNDANSAQLAFNQLEPVSIKRSTTEDVDTNEVSISKSKYICF